MEFYLRALIICFAFGSSYTHAASLRQNIKDANQLQLNSNARNAKFFEVDSDYVIYTHVELFFNTTNTVKSCRGNLVHSKWTLTAAECLDKSKVDGGSVTFDFKRILYNGSRDVVTHKAFFDKLRYVIHPKYNPKTGVSNLALMSHNNMYDWYITALLKLPSQNDYFESLKEKNCVVPGSNARQPIDDETSDKEDIDTSFNTTVISPNWCKVLYPFSPLKYYHICASGVWSKGLRKEDIGASLLILPEDPRMRNEIVIAGIVTAVRPWAKQVSFPMVFTGLYPYVDWIRKIAH